MGKRLITDNFYCQGKCGFEDFDIAEHDALLKEVWKMPISEAEQNKIIDGDPCTKQCFECMAIVGETRKKTAALPRSTQNPTQ